MRPDWACVAALFWGHHLCKFFYFYLYFNVIFFLFLSSTVLLMCTSVKNSETPDENRVSSLNSTVSLHPAAAQESYTQASST